MNLRRVELVFLLILPLYILADHFFIHGYLYDIGDFYALLSHEFFFALSVGVGITLYAKRNYMNANARDV